MIRCIEVIATECIREIEPAMKRARLKERPQVTTTMNLLAVPAVLLQRLVARPNELRLLASNLLLIPRVLRHPL